MAIEHLGHHFFGLEKSMMGKNSALRLRGGPLQAYQSHEARKAPEKPMELIEVAGSQRKRHWPAIWSLERTPASGRASAR